MAEINGNKVSESFTTSGEIEYPANTVVFFMLLGNRKLGSTITNLKVGTAPGLDDVAEVASIAYNVPIILAPQDFKKKVFSQTNDVKLYVSADDFGTGILGMTLFYQQAFEL